MAGFNKPRQSPSVNGACVPNSSETRLISEAALLRVGGELHERIFTCAGFLLLFHQDLPEGIRGIQAGHIRGIVIQECAFKIDLHAFIGESHNKVLHALIGSDLLCCHLIDLRCFNVAVPCESDLGAICIFDYSGLGAQLVEVD
jgi:hypothetical protein